MAPIYLKEVEQAAKAGPAGAQFAAMEAQGIPVPQILYLFAYKPRITEHLSRFTEELMRGPSPLTPSQRELSAARVGIFQSFKTGGPINPSAPLRRSGRRGHRRWHLPYTRRHGTAVGFAVLAADGLALNGGVRASALLRHRRIFAAPAPRRIPGALRGQDQRVSESGGLWGPREGHR
jgi:hypothetical protein